MQSAKLSSSEALDMLREGNARYVAGAAQKPNQDRQRRSLTAWQGQQPFAAVLACSDSRVPVELLFDRGIGDIFVVRVAGNVAGPTEMGSIEYAVETFGDIFVRSAGPHALRSRNRSCKRRRSPRKHDCICGTHRSSRGQGQG